MLIINVSNLNGSRYFNTQCSQSACGGKDQEQHRNDTQIYFAGLIISSVEYFREPGHAL